MGDAAALREANQLLRTELASLKALVQALRESRGSSDDDGDDELLALENDLLRAQLKEQHDFLEGCRTLMQTMPELASSSSSFAAETTPATIPRNKLQLLHQGSENSLTMLHLLVSRCQSRAKDWQPVQLPTHLFKSSGAIPGFNLTCNLQRSDTGAGGDASSSPMIYLRVDGCFPNVSPETVADGYWATLAEAAAFCKTLESFCNTTTLPSHSPVPFTIRELMSDRKPNGDVTAVSLYRELAGNTSSSKDWIYCLTRTKQDVALSTLAMPAELNPTVTTRRVQHTRRVVASEGDFCPRKKSRGCSSTSQLVGKRECIVLARSCMKDIAPLPDSSHLVSKHAIAADGLFVWQDEVSIDFEVKCKEGVEIQRKRVPATRACSFVGLASDALPIQDLAMYNNVVDSAGRATERYARLINILYTLMGGGTVTASAAFAAVAAESLAGLADDYGEYANVEDEEGEGVE